jgi:hypothetical protein
MANVSWEVKFDLGPEFENLMTRMPAEIAIKAMDSGARAAAKPVAELAAKLAPRGDETGTSKKQSKKYRGADSRYNQEPLHKKITYTIRKYKKNVLGVVGAKYPDGNEIFPLLSGHRFVRWDSSKAVSGFVQKQEDNFLIKAFRQKEKEIGAIALKKAGEVFQKAMGG